MKRYIRSMLVLILGATLLGVGSTQSLAAENNTTNGDQNQTSTTNTDSQQTPSTVNNKNNKALHRDGSAFVKEKRITQADRQAVADRSKAKGMAVPKVGEPATSDAINTQTGSEAKQ